MSEDKDKDQQEQEKDTVESDYQPLVAQSKRTGEGDSLEEQLSAYVEYVPWLQDLKRVSKYIYTLYAEPVDVRINVRDNLLHIPGRSKGQSFANILVLRRLLHIPQPAKVQQVVEILESVDVEVVEQSRAGLYYKDPLSGEGVVYYPWIERYYPVTEEGYIEGDGYYLPIDSLEDRYTVTTTYSEAVEIISETIEALDGVDIDISYDGGDWIQLKHKYSTYWYHPMNRWKTSETGTVYACRDAEQLIRKYIVS